MADPKPGYSVHIKLEVRDPEGNVISDYPSGAQYGYDNDGANLASISIAKAIGTKITEWANFASDGKITEFLNPRPKPKG